MLISIIRRLFSVLIVPLIFRIVEIGGNFSVVSILLICELFDEILQNVTVDIRDGTQFQSLMLYIKYGQR